MANIVSDRLTIGMLGYGLVEAIADADLLALNPVDLASVGGPTLSRCSKTPPPPVWAGLAGKPTGHHSFQRRRRP